MPGIIASLSGAPGAATTAGNYYQNAANQIVSSTGSPAAQDFIGEQNAALQPQFQTQDQALKAQLAAQGITGSGAAKQGFGNLINNQQSTIAGVDAPLYSQALGQYGSIIGQEPGAQNSAYQNAIQQFYQAIQGAGSLAGAAFGVPGFGGNGAGTGSVDSPDSYALSPADDSSIYNTPPPTNVASSYAPAGNS